MAEQMEVARLTFLGEMQEASELTSDEGAHAAMIAAFAKYDASVCAVYQPLVEAARAVAERPHVIQIREGGWGIQHPLQCRPALTECLVHRAASQWDGPPREPGQYRIDAFGNVQEPYNEPDPAIAFVAALAALAEPTEHPIPSSVSGEGEGSVTE